MVRREATAARAATETESDTDTATLSRTGKPWNVVVHDDPITAMDYVTKIFMQVFGYPKAKAERLMLLVHNTGRAIVWTGAREAAEVHVQTLQGRHLSAALEPGSE